MAKARRRRYRHLPEGHAPGPQSRSRHGPLGWFLMLLPLVLSLIFVGLAATLVLGASSAESTSGSLVGAAVLGLPGMAGVVFCSWLLRRRAPKPPTHLRLDVDAVEVRRGQPVTATLTITDLGKVAHHELRVGLVCTEWYEAARTEYNPDTPTFRQTLTLSGIVHERWTTVEKNGEPQSVTFHIPPDAPFSYEGTSLTFAWRLTARQVVRRRTDPTVDVPIWVAP